MSTIHKPSSTTYDPEFKKHGVQLLHTSGRPLAQIARELGVHTTSTGHFGTASRKAWP